MPSTAHSDTISVSFMTASPTERDSSRSTKPLIRHSLNPQVQLICSTPNWFPLVFDTHPNLGTSIRIDQNAIKFLPISATACSSNSGSVNSPSASCETYIICIANICASAIADHDIEGLNLSVMSRVWGVLRRTHLLGCSAPHQSGCCQPDEPKFVAHSHH